MGKFEFVVGDQELTRLAGLRSLWWELVSWNFRRSSPARLAR
jgi:hypothetical protein